jgi:hypothetical protein
MRPGTRAAHRQLVNLRAERRQRQPGDLGVDLGGHRMDTRCEAGPDRRISLARPTGIPQDPRIARRSSVSLTADQPDQGKVPLSSTYSSEFGRTP